MNGIRVLIVDLNNFAMYPTVSVGYIVSICRQAGMEASVFSPLSIGLPGITREKPANFWRLQLERCNFWAAQTRHRWIRNARKWIGRNLRSPISRNHRRTIDGFRTRLQESRAQVVLISTYLMYREIVEEISDICDKTGVPVVLGGPYFAHADVNRAWASIRGVTAMVAGEVEPQLPAIIRTVFERGNLTAYSGVLIPNGSTHHNGSIAAPLKDLDSLPFPDYSGFPWHLYPHNIAPIITGRGCGWGHCTFCSDVTSTAGRTYRSRRPDDVLAEIRHHHESLGTKLFVFVDLKLNSNLPTWRAILSGLQDVVPGARWIGSVHVGNVGDNGLTADELRAAARSGCVRLTTGLESGSQRVLNLLKKGTRVERISEYLRDASAAGISMRTTMIAGYPGDRAEDVEASARFVDEHNDVLGRVKLCSFTLIAGTSVEEQLRRDPTSLPIEDMHPRYENAFVDHYAPETGTRSYRAAMSRLLTAIHRVNRRPLVGEARAFEGVM